MLAEITQIIPYDSLEDVLIEKGRCAVKIDNHLQFHYIDIKTAEVTYRAG